MNNIEKAKAIQIQADACIEDIAKCMGQSETLSTDNKALCRTVLLQHIYKMMQNIK